MTEVGKLRVELPAGCTVIPPLPTASAPALCTTCDHRLDDAAIRACPVRDCPHAQREAA